MKNQHITSIAILTFSVLLVGCSNGSSKDTASSKSSESSSSISMTANEISELQGGTADSVVKSKYVSYANSLSKNYKKTDDQYHKEQISSSDTHPENGDWQIDKKHGIEMTYLSNLHDISNQDIKGLKLYNTQYWLFSIDKISKDALSNIVKTSDTHPVFNKDNEKISNGDAAVFATVETDFKNTTSQTLTYDGLSGYAGGDYDFTTPDGNQYDREKIMYDDETGNVEVQAGKHVEDKDLTICLATGKTLTQALKKVTQSSLSIKTAGAETKDMDQLDGTRTIQIDLKH